MSEFKEMEYVDERRMDILASGKYNDFQYYIISYGYHPCAYIEIPREHYLYGKHYEEIDINVHGGLTYSNNYLRNIKYDTWFIGWDYAHFNDYSGYDIRFVGTEFEEPNNKKWTTIEILEEVIDVINQIRKGVINETPNH